MTEDVKRKSGRPRGSGSRATIKNITVTNPNIINMLSDYCDELHNELGFRPTITQALTRLLSNRKNK